jgi:hypothetical protein
MSAEDPFASLAASSLSKYRLMLPDEPEAG